MLSTWFNKPGYTGPAPSSGAVSPLLWVLAVPPELTMSRGCLPPGALGPSSAPSLQLLPFCLCFISHCSFSFRLSPVSHGNTIALFFRSLLPSYTMEVGALTWPLSAGHQVQQAPSGVTVQSHHCQQQGHPVCQGSWVWLPELVSCQWGRTPLSQQGCWTPLWWPGIVRCVASRGCCSTGPE